MYLIFDTETTNLPKRWDVPVSDLDNWPRLVQLAWMLYDPLNGDVLEQSQIIKPENFEIPAESTKIHGITTERANKEGIPLENALEDFAYVLNHSKTLVAHNMDFDEKIMGAEFIRKQIKNNLFMVPKICTMKSKATINFCKISGFNGYKWPSLMELHQKLFNTSFDGAHDALNDVRACAKCFLELKKRNIL